MDFKRLVLTGVDLSAIEQDAALLGALGTLAGKWRDLAREAGKADIADTAAIEALVRTLVADIGSDSVKAAFDRLGLADAHATLTGAASKLTALLDAVPQTVRDLMLPVADAPELIGWNPLNQSAIVTPDDRFSLTLSASAGLSVAPRATWPFSGDGRDGSLLQVRAAGAANANAKGEWPVNVLKLGASAGAKADLSLAYYAETPDPAQPLALELARLLPNLPDPFDFDALWDGFAGSRLYGVEYAYNGSVDLALSVTLGVEEEILSGVDLDASAEIEVTAHRAASYQLSVRRETVDGRMALVIAQSRKADAVDVLGLSAGITLDLSGLAQAVHAKLKPLVDQWDSALGKVRPFLTPGTYLREKLGGELGKAADRLVKDDALRTALVSDLRGAIGFDPADSAALDTWLQEQISGAANRAVAAATGAADDAVARLRNELANAIPAVAQPQLQPVVDEVLGGLVTTLSAGLEGFARELVSGTSIAKPLETLLKRLNLKSAKAANAADKALAGVRAVIDKYDGLIHKILAATTEQARARVSISLQLEERREDSFAITIKGRMLAKTAANAALFAAIRRGDSRSAVTLLDGAARADFAVDSESQAQWTSKRSTKVAGGLILFGFGGTFESLASGDAAMVLGGDSVLRVKAKGEYRESVTFSKESSEVSLLAAAALVAGAKEDGKTPDHDRAKSELGVTVQSDDEALSRKELVKFLDSLKAGDLVGDAAIATALRWLDEWDGPGNDRKVSATLLAKLWLTPVQMRQLLHLGQRINNRLTAEALRSIGLSGVRALHHSGALNGKTMTRLEWVAMDGFKLPKDTDPATLVDRAWDDGAWRKISGNLAGKGSTAFAAPKSVVPEFDRLRGMAKDLGEMIDIMGQIYLSPPKAPGSDGPGWEPEDYAGQSKRIAALAVRWAKTNPALDEVFAAVHARTVALLGVLCDLSGADRQQALRIVMTRKAAAGADAVTVVLGEGSG